MCENILFKINQGRAVVGIDEDDTDLAASGKTGCEKAYTLTTSEIPSHTHSLDGTAKSAVSHTHTVSRTAQATGGGSSHNNLQPYICVY